MASSLGLQTEEQKREARQQQSYSEWARDSYNTQYERWVPWLEDRYLAWFGKDNKASYATKGKCQATQ